MAFPASTEFSKFSDNLRSIDAALTQIERAHKRAVRENDAPSLSAFRKIHLLTVGVRAEAALRKIVQDPTGFNARERALIWKSTSQGDRWDLAVDLAARRHYQVPVHLEISDVAPPDVADRIDVTKALLREELAPVITDRNKLAHGQWVWQLRSREDEKFLQDQQKFEYNYVEIHARHQLLKSIAQLVHALAVSDPTFQREFVRIAEEIDAARERINAPGYAEYVVALRASAEARKRSK